MTRPEASAHQPGLQNAIEISVRLFVIAVFAIWCFRILGPFINLIVWGGVIAVAVYPLLLRLTDALGGRRKLAITLVVLAGLSVVIVPLVMISGSLMDSAQEIGADVAEGTLKIPPPPARVAEWPVVGTRVSDFWQLASANLQAFVQKYHAEMSEVTSWMLSAAAGAGGSVLQLVFSLLVSAVLLANADACVRGTNRLADRLLGGEGGPELTGLAAATVRSVAVGVLGVAFIQSALAALGLIWAGVPAPGVWALLVLLLAIVQLPPILILLPIALWVFGTADSQLVAWGFLIYSILVSLSDAFLKPLLLGRGLDVPMVVILLGALGGMVLSGVIGLFVGAVVLALGYRFLKAWLEWDQERAEQSATADAT